MSEYKVLTIAELKKKNKNKLQQNPEPELEVIMMGHKLEDQVNKDPLIDLINFDNKIPKKLYSLFKNLYLEANQKDPISQCNIILNHLNTIENYLVNSKFFDFKQPPDRIISSDLDWFPDAEALQEINDQLFKKLDKAEQDEDLTMKEKFIYSKVLQFLQLSFLKLKPIQILVNKDNISLVNKIIEQTITLGGFPFISLKKQSSEEEQNYLLIPQQVELQQINHEGGNNEGTETALIQSSTQEGSSLLDCLCPKKPLTVQLQKDNQIQPSQQPIKVQTRQYTQLKDQSQSIEDHQIQTQQQAIQVVQLQKDNQIQPSQQPIKVQTRQYTQLKDTSQFIENPVNQMKQAFNFSKILNCFLIKSKQDFHSLLKSNLYDDQENKVNNFESNLAEFLAIQEVPFVGQEEVLKCMISSKFLSEWIILKAKFINDSLPLPPAEKSLPENKCSLSNLAIRHKNFDFLICILQQLKSKNQKLEILKQEMDRIIETGQTYQKQDLQTFVTKYFTEILNTLDEDQLRQIVYILQNRLQKQLEQSESTNNQFFLVNGNVLKEQVTHLKMQERVIFWFFMQQEFSNGLKILDLQVKKQVDFGMVIPLLIEKIISLKKNKKGDFMFWHKSKQSLIDILFNVSKAKDQPTTWFQSTLEDVVQILQKSKSLLSYQLKLEIAILANEVIFHARQKVKDIHLDNSLNSIIKNNYAYKLFDFIKDELTPDKTQDELMEAVVRSIFNLGNEEVLRAVLELIKYNNKCFPVNIVKAVVYGLRIWHSLIQFGKPTVRKAYSEIESLLFSAQYYKQLTQLMLAIYSENQIKERILNFKFSDKLNERIIENLYIYEEDYNFQKKEGALANLCEEIKPHLSDDIFYSIFYDKFPGYDKKDSTRKTILMEGITLFINPKLTCASINFIQFIKDLPRGIQIELCDKIADNYIQLCEKLRPDENIFLSFKSNQESSQQMSILMQAAARFIISQNIPEDDKDAQLNEIISRGVNLQGYLKQQRGFTISGNEDEEPKDFFDHLFSQEIKASMPRDLSGPIAAAIVVALKHRFSSSFRLNLGQIQNKQQYNSKFYLDEVLFQKMLKNESYLIEKTKEDLNGSMQDDFEQKQRCQLVHPIQPFVCGMISSLVAYCSTDYLIKFIRSILKRLEKEQKPSLEVNTFMCTVFSSLVASSFFVNQKEQFHSVNPSMKVGKEYLVLFKTLQSSIACNKHYLNLFKTELNEIHQNTNISISDLEIFRNHLNLIKIPEIKSQKIYVLDAILNKKKLEKVFEEFFKKIFFSENPNKKLLGMLFSSYVQFLGYLNQTTFNRQDFSWQFEVIKTVAMQNILSYYTQPSEKKECTNQITYETQIITCLIFDLFKINAKKYSYSYRDEDKKIMHPLHIDNLIFLIHWPVLSSAAKDYLRLIREGKLDFQEKNNIGYVLSGVGRGDPSEIGSQDQQDEENGEKQEDGVNDNAYPNNINKLFQDLEKKIKENDKHFSQESDGLCCCSNQLPTRACPDKLGSDIIICYIQLILEIQFLIKQRAKNLPNLFQEELSGQLEEILISDKNLSFYNMMSHLLAEKSVNFDLADIYKKEEERCSIMQTFDAVQIFLLQVKNEPSLFSQFFKQKYNYQLVQNLAKQNVGDEKQSVQKRFKMYLQIFIYPLLNFERLLDVDAQINTKSVGTDFLLFENQAQVILTTIQNAFEDQYFQSLINKNQVFTIIKSLLFKNPCFNLGQQFQGQVLSNLKRQILNVLLKFVMSKKQNDAEYAVLNIQNFSDSEYDLEQGQDKMSQISFTPDIFLYLYRKADMYGEENDKSNFKLNLIKPETYELLSTFFTRVHKPTEILQQLIIHNLLDFLPTFLKLYFDDCDIQNSDQFYETIDFLLFNVCQASQIQLPAIYDAQLEVNHHSKAVECILKTREEIGQRFSENSNEVKILEKYPNLYLFLIMNTHWSIFKVFVDKFGFDQIIRSFTTHNSKPYAGDFTFDYQQVDDFLQNIINLLLSKNFKIMQKFSQGFQFQSGMSLSPSFSPLFQRIMKDTEKFLNKNENNEFMHPLFLALKLHSIPVANTFPIDNHQITSVEKNIIFQLLEIKNDAEKDEIKNDPKKQEAEKDDVKEDVAEKADVEGDDAEQDDPQDDNPEEDEPEEDDPEEDDPEEDDPEEDDAQEDEDSQDQDPHEKWYGKDKKKKTATPRDENGQLLLTYSHDDIIKRAIKRKQSFSKWLGRNQIPCLFNNPFQELSFSKITNKDLTLDQIKGSFEIIYLIVSVPSILNVLKFEGNFRLFWGLEILAVLPAITENKKEVIQGYRNLLVFTFVLFYKFKVFEFEPQYVQDFLEWFETEAQKNWDADTILQAKAKISDAQEGQFIQILF